MGRMVNVHIDPAFDDAERRRRLYGGDVLVYTQVPEVAAFAAYTREMITELFAPHDPISIQTVYSPEELADLLIEFKPRWIHDPRSMEHVRTIARALGCEPGNIHADVPKLRTAFPEGGLSTGIAYAFQAHRDTWYAAPKAQINWWMPVWPVAENNIMEFYPHGFGAQVENNSGDYDYYVANTWRGNIKDFSGGKDARVHPAPVHGIGPDDTRLTVGLASAEAFRGRGAAALELARRAIATERRLAGGGVSRNLPELLYFAAEAAVVADERDAALAWLGELLATPSIYTPPWLRVDPTWAPLRGDARFEALLAAS